MANTEELIKAICKLIETGPLPIPITLMNHGVDEAAAIIGGVVERCAHESIALTRVSIDPGLGIGSTGRRVRIRPCRASFHVWGCSAIRTA